MLTERRKGQVPFIPLARLPQWMIVYRRNQINIEKQILLPENLSPRLLPRRKWSRMIVLGITTAKVQEAKLLVIGLGLPQDTVEELEAIGIEVEDAVEAEVALVPIAVLVPVLGLGQESVTPVVGIAEEGEEAEMIVRALITTHPQDIGPDQKIENLTNPPNLYPIPHRRTI